MTTLSCVTTGEQAAVYRAHLERPGADGGPLTARTTRHAPEPPHGSTCAAGAPLEVRRQLHTEIRRALPVPTPRYAKTGERSSWPGRRVPANPWRKMLSATRH